MFVLLLPTVLSRSDRAPESAGHTRLGRARDSRVENPVTNTTCLADGPGAPSRLPARSRLPQWALRGFWPAAARRSGV